jgi:hypothetical protein
VPDLIQLRPEDRLLVCLSRRRLDPSQQQRARELARDPLDWSYLVASANAHGVAGLCYARLVELRQQGLDVRLEPLEGAAKAIAARSLLLASRLIAILDQLKQQKLPAVPYKGPVLAMMAYGSLAARDFVDLDLIVRHQDLFSAWEVIEAEGHWAQPSIEGLSPNDSRIPGQYEFQAPTGDYLVELHTERTLRHFPRPLRPERIFADLKPFELLGRQIPSFSPADALIFLSVHHSKDFWSRLLWIADIAELVQLEGFSWTEALTRAQALGCRRIVNVAILLVYEWLEAPIPAAVLREAKADRAARKQARWVAGRLFAPRPMGNWEQLRYRMRMVAGFWPGLLYAVRLATTPDAEDWNALRLPRSLGFAYPLLRPLRLLWGNRR